MTKDDQAHETSTSVVNIAAAEPFAGADLALKAKVSCSSNCDLRGATIRIADDKGAIVKEIELVSFDEATNETDEFVVKAPVKPGEYRWKAVFAAQQKEGISHEETSVPFSFVVKPHTTSMAVWDVPSPIVSNAKFKLKVGVTCSAGCKLTGREIEIYDHAGARAATDTLGGVPWSDAGALYWAEVELQAPGKEGYYTWEAKFLKPDLELPHEGASHAFVFGTGRQPEHVVTIQVLDIDTKAPIKHADVILHPYRDHSDELGMARLAVPNGEYELYVTATDKQTFRTTVKVASDVAIRAELLVAPVEDTGG